LRHLPRQAREQSIRLFGEQVAPHVTELPAGSDDSWEPTGREFSQITQAVDAARAS
jgi:hypothetical protein